MLAKKLCPALAMACLLAVSGCAPTQSTRAPSDADRSSQEASRSDASADKHQNHGHKHQSHDGEHGHAEGDAAHQRHRKMPHRFADADHWAGRFEDPSRDAWQQPDQVLAAMELEPDMRVADIGSATGYFAVRLARAVSDGEVIGLDIEPDMVRYLNERAEDEGLPNLTSVLAQPDDPQLDKSIDRVLIVNTYHHISERRAYFEKVRASLAPHGRLTVVDYKPGELPVGPPEKHRIPLEQVDEELSSVGFERTGLVLLPYQFVASYELSEAGR